MEEFDKVHTQLSLLATFFFLDTLFTIIFIQMNLATEGNPVMAFYYSINPAAFFFAKMILSIGGIYLMIPYLHRPMVRKTLSTLTLFYLVIIIYHLLGMGLYLPL